MDSSISDMPSIADLARAYLAAEYRWERNGDWHDLRIGLPVPALELLYPWARTFGLIAAWNPGSVPRQRADNLEAAHALEARLHSDGIRFVAASAAAIDGSWHEPGVLVLDMEVGAFDVLARCCGQLGTLWWVRGEAGRLRMHAARPGGFDEDAAVDWLQPANLHP